MTRFLILNALLLAATAHTTEPIRGRPVGTARAEGPSVSFGLDELVEVELPQAVPIYRGIQIDLDFPREVLPYRQAMAVVLFHNLRPRYRLDLQDYLAQRVGSEILPAARPFSIRIPLHQGMPLPATRGVWDLRSPLSSQHGNLALMIIPIEKDLPRHIQQTSFSVSVRLLPGTHAGIRLELPELSPSERERVRIRWGTVTAQWEPLIYVPAGTQELVVLDTPLPYQAQRLTLKPGEIREIVLRPAETEAYFVWDLPQGATVEINGQIVPNDQPQRVPFGVQRIQVRYGGSLLTKFIEVTRPGRYLVTLEMDLKIEGE